MSKEKKLHGNQAKVDPEKKITGLNVTNAAALTGQNEGGDPAMNDVLAEAARVFEEENKK